MSDLNVSPEFQRLMRATAVAKRVGLTSAFAMILAEVTSWAVSRPRAGPAYVLTGATSWIIFWWFWGKLLRRVGVLSK